MSNVINIDGKEYPIDNLKNDQKVLIDQITLCQNKINELSALVRQIDIFQIAKNDYVKKLSTSLQTDETLKNIEDSQAGMTKSDINAILMELSVLKNDMYHFRQDMERRVSRLERIVISITAFYVLSSFGVIFNTIVL